MPPRREWPLAAALVLSLGGRAASDGPAPRVFADFEGVPQREEALARPPSTATARRIPEGDGFAFEVSGRQVPPGIAGVRVPFHDARAPRATFVDASRYDYLTFRIRATGATPRLLVTIADTAGAVGDAGEVTRFLPQGLSAEWQQVAIPLGMLGLNRKALAALALMAADPSAFAFAIDDVALKRDPEDALPPLRRRSGVP